MQDARCKQGPNSNLQISKLVIICFLLLVSCFLLPSRAQVPQISLPFSIDVEGNGLRSVAFVVKERAVSESEGLSPTLRYYLEGVPEQNPPTFDEKSKLFFWTPNADQVGAHTFTLVIKDPMGNQVSESVTINVLKTASLEALPKRWEDLKKAEQYLIGRDYFPATHLIEMQIGADPEYAVEVSVRDSLGQDCLLTYIPKDGRAEINRGRRTAEIYLGGDYASSFVKTVRLDIYEDLFNYLGLVFARINFIKVNGDFILKDLSVYDDRALVSSLGEDEIFLPRINLAFDDRFYEDNLYSKKEPVSISDVPEIKIDFSTSSGVKWRRGRLFINEKEYSAARGDFSLVVVKPYKDISTFDVLYVMYLLRIPAVKKLPFGEHHLLFTAENAYGMVISKEVFARVVSIPSQIEGAPMVYPSPFNPSVQSEVKIQYRLSIQTNVEMVIFGGDGSTVMKRRFNMGEEGGRKGLNTVTWDGKTDAGRSVSNGIYIGALIDRDENRILEKFRLTVFR
jgi:hypothetical protein